MPAEAPAQPMPGENVGSPIDREDAEPAEHGEREENIVDEDDGMNVDCIADPPTLKGEYPPALDKDGSGVRHLPDLLRQEGVQHLPGFTPSVTLRDDRCARGKAPRSRSEVAADLAENAPFKITLLFGV